VFREGLRPPDPFRERPPLERLLTQDGMSLDALSRLGPLLVVCLPDRGERGLLAEVAAHRGAIERSGVRLALVHPAEAPPELPEALRYVARVADPALGLYAFLGLGRTKGTLFRREGQASGLFLLRDGAVVRAVASPADLA